MVGHFLVVPGLIALAVADERQNGTLDQLRAAPTRPHAVLAGFVLGSPVRAYTQRSN